MAHHSDLPPLDVGSRKQLLIDHRFLAVQQGITLRANPPRKAEAVIAPEMPWETYRVGGGTVLEDGGLYKMWYGAMPTVEPPGQPGETVVCKTCGQPTPADAVLCRQCGYALVPLHSYACYATSTDGIHWERPRLGLSEFGGSRDNNIVPVGGSVMIDPNAPPDERYRSLGHDNLYVFSSPDGIHWHRSEQQALPFSADTQNQLLWDARLGRYVAYLRGFPGQRTVVRAEMDNPLHMPWAYTPNPNAKADRHGDTYITTELPTIMRSDEWDPPRTDVYNPCVHLYGEAQDVYLAFPSVYRHYPGPGAPDAARRPTHRYHRIANDGAVEVQLAVSRDGAYFARPDRTPYVGLGLFGESDGGGLYLLEGMLHRGDEVWQYCSTYRVTHGDFQPSQQRGVGAITRLVQQRDRFIGACTDHGGGEFLTPRLTMAGRFLELNIDCGAMGEARVEIRDAANVPVPGFGMDDCDPVDLNGLRHRVSWNGQADLSALAGHGIRLYVKMRSARLYALQFVG